MSERVQLPQIEGKREPPNEAEERESRQTLLEQVGQMDLIPVPPVDETPYDRDTETMEEQQEKVQQAVAFAPKKISDRKRASLERAREALAEKRRRMKAEGKDAAQGSPAIDGVIEYLKKLEDKLDSINVQQRNNDIVRINANEAPLQSQQIVQPGPTRLEVAPSQWNQYTIRQPNDVPKQMELMSYREPSYAEPPKPPMKQQVPVVQEQMKFNQKFKEAFSKVNYYTDQVRERAQTDPSQGKKSNSNHIMW